LRKSEQYIPTLEEIRRMDPGETPSWAKHPPFSHVQEGNQFHTNGRAGVPQFRTTPMDLRDRVDPNDPITLSGPVRTIKLPK